MFTEITSLVLCIHPDKEFVLCNFVTILSVYGSLVLLPRLAPSYKLPAMVYGSGDKNFTP